MHTNITDQAIEFDKIDEKNQSTELNDPSAASVTSEVTSLNAKHVILVNYGPMHEE